MHVVPAAVAGHKPRQRLVLLLLIAAAAAAGLLARHRPAGYRLQTPCQSRALLPPRHRDLIGQLLEEEGATVGAELGVQRGWFANVTLSSWPSCTRYYLVDAWAHQENYAEGANMPEEQQQANFELAQQRLARFSNRTVFLRMFTSEAVKQIQDESLDWVYIDARHDYCGCWEDMLQWWPKLRPNGLFMGHDYITAAGVRQIHPQEDWSLCANGTRHEGAVEGAVRDFAQLHFLTVAVTYAEGHPWKSWMVRKPARC